MVALTTAANNSFVLALESNVAGLRAAFHRAVRSGPQDLHSCRMISWSGQEALGHGYMKVLSPPRTQINYGGLPHGLEDLRVIILVYSLLVTIYEQCMNITVTFILPVFASIYWNPLKLYSSSSTMNNLESLINSNTSSIINWLAMINRTRCRVHAFFWIFKQITKGWTCSDTSHNRRRSAYWTAARHLRCSERYVVDMVILMLWTHHDGWLVNDWLLNDQFMVNGCDSQRLMITGDAWPWWLGMMGWGSGSDQLSYWKSKKRAVVVTIYLFPEMRVGYYHPETLIAWLQCE